MEQNLYIILAGGRGERLKPLTNKRPKPLVRFGISSRIIDFTLYNCLASGKGDAIVLTQYLSQMLEEYIQMHWQSAFEMQGRYLEILAGDKTPKGRFMDTADAVYQALAKRNNLPRYLVVLSADHIYRMDYGPMVRYHMAHGGAATVGAVECDRKQSCRFGIIKAGDDGAISSFHEKPRSLEGITPRHKRPLASMGIYVFTTKILLDYLENNQEEQSHDFGRDILPQMASAGNAWVYLFVRFDGKRAYWQDVGDLSSYWQSSMELLNGHHIRDFDTDHISGLNCPPFSRVNIISRNENGRRKIYNSMISENARVNEATIEESVICPGVCIEDGAIVKRSVILDGAVIRKRTEITNAVVEPYREISFNISTPRIRGIC